MGISTDGQICYGVLFEDDYEFPWDAEEYGGDIEAWWRAVNGYQPPFELYDSDGNYLDGIEPPQMRIDAYFGARHEWDEQHAVPVARVNACSGDHPLYIVAVPSTVRKAYRGWPETFNPTDLQVDSTAVDELCEFCDKYGLAYQGEPAWYLSSYYG